MRPSPQTPGIEAVGGRSRARTATPFRGALPTSISVLIPPLGAVVRALGHWRPCRLLLLLAAWEFPPPLPSLPPSPPSLTKVG